MKKLSKEYYFEFDFAHDVFGINHHLNRKSYQLEDCFLPRYAA